MPPPPNKTNAKFWCAYCRVYVYDNNICRRNHENTPQHKDALKRFVSRVQKEEKERSAAQAQSTGAPSSARTAHSDHRAGSGSFYAAPAPKAQPVPLLAVRPPRAVLAAAAKRPKLAIGAPSTQMILAQSAIVGSWQPIAAPLLQQGSERAPLPLAPPPPSLEAPKEAHQTPPISPPGDGADSPKAAHLPPAPEPPAQPTPPPVSLPLRKFSKPASLRKL